MKLAHVRDKRKSSEWDQSSDDDEGHVSSTENTPKRSRSAFAARTTEGKKIEKDPRFDEKRKMHYNEFERVKAWRRAHANEDEDDEEGDEDLEMLEETKPAAPLDSLTANAQHDKKKHHVTTQSNASVQQ